MQSWSIQSGSQRSSALICGSCSRRRVKRMSRIKVAVAGCGRVSEYYLADLQDSPHVELVSVCDAVPQRAEERAREFGVPYYFPEFDRMLSGPAFDLLVNLTAMPCHFPLNLQALRT